MEIPKGLDEEPSRASVPVPTLERRISQHEPPPLPHSEAPDLQPPPELNPKPPDNPPPSSQSFRRGWPKDRGLEKAASSQSQPVESARKDKSSGSAEVSSNGEPIKDGGPLSSLINGAKSWWKRSTPPVTGKVTRAQACEFKVESEEGGNQRLLYHALGKKEAGKEILGVTPSTPAGPSAPSAPSQQGFSSRPFGKKTAQTPSEDEDWQSWGEVRASGSFVGISSSASFMSQVSVGSEMLMCHTPSAIAMQKFLASDDDGPSNPPPRLNSESNDGNSSGSPSAGHNSLVLKTFFKAAPVDVQLKKEQQVQQASTEQSQDNSDRPGKNPKRGFTLLGSQVNNNGSEAGSLQQLLLEQNSKSPPENQAPAPPRQPTQRSVPHEFRAEQLEGQDSRRHLFKPLGKQADDGDSDAESDSQQSDASWQSWRSGGTMSRTLSQASCASEPPDMPRSASAAAMQDFLSRP